MPGSSKVNGVWRTATGLSVKVSGQWKTATSAFVKVGGQWKQWFASKIQDAFNRISTVTGLGTSDSGQVWNATRGNWRISGSNTAIADDAASTYPIASINLGNTDVKVQTDTTGGVGPVFWLTDSGSWWAVYPKYTSSTQTFCNQNQVTNTSNPPSGSCCGSVTSSTSSVCDQNLVSSGSNPPSNSCCSGVSTSTVCNQNAVSALTSSFASSSAFSNAYGCCSGVSISGGGTACTGGFAQSPSNPPAGNCCTTPQPTTVTNYSCSGSSSCTGAGCTPAGCGPSPCGGINESSETTYSCSGSASCTGAGCTPTGCAPSPCGGVSYSTAPGCSYETADSCGGFNCSIPGLSNCCSDTIYVNNSVTLVSSYANSCCASNGQCSGTATCSTGGSTYYQVNDGGSCTGFNGIDPGPGGTVTQVGCSNCTGLGPCGNGGFVCCRVTTAGSSTTYNCSGCTYTTNYASGCSKYAIAGTTTGTCSTTRTATGTTITRSCTTTRTSTSGTEYYCYTSQQNQPSYYNCNTGTSTTYSCYTGTRNVTNYSCFTSTTSTTTYISSLVVASSVSNVVSEVASTTISNNTSGFTTVGSVYVATVGNQITATAYSGSNLSGSQVGSTLTHNPTSPTKGTNVGIIKAPSTGSQGSTTDNFLATI